MKVIGATPEYIKCITKIKYQILQYIFKKVYNHNWDPFSYLLVLNDYVLNAPHVRLKIKITHEFEQQILKKVITNQFSREKSYTYITIKYNCFT